MKNLTIRKQILLGMGCLMALLVVVGALAVAALSQLTHTVDYRLANDAMPGLYYSGEINNYLEEAFVRVLLASQAESLEKQAGFLKQVDENLAGVEAALTNYDASITQAEDRKNFDTFKQYQTAYAALRVKYLDLLKAGQKAEAADLLRTQLVPAYTTYTDQGTVLLEWNVKAGKEIAAQVINDGRHTTLILEVVGAIGLLVSIAIGYRITNGINRALYRISSSIGEGAAQVNSAAAQVSSSSQSLAEGSSEQAASIEETSASLEEMSSMTKRNADNSQQANNLAKQTRAAADKGVADMQAMNQAMAEIKQSSDEVAKIIKTIDEIAFQTNILALNAAVEAARAGEAGMGFAVVADEVRNLAQRSAQAAKETALKIEGAIGKTSQGVNLSGRVAEALNEIVAKARQMDELAAEVANASSEQSQGITQVNTAVSSMDKVTQGAAANAEECAAAAEELNSQAMAMKQTVGELLQLVGSQQGTGHQSHLIESAPATVKRTAATKLPAAGHPVPKAAKSVVTPAAHRRTEIPMADDFKNF